MQKIGALLAALGVGVAALGGYLRSNAVGLVGLSVLGAGVFCWGVSGVAGGRMLFYHPGLGGRYDSTFRGFAARAWGLLLCAAGAAISACCLVVLFGGGAALGGASSSITSGGAGAAAAMIVIGLVGGVYATTMILGREEDRRTRLRLLMSLPWRLLGVVVLLASLALATAGVLRLASPRLYDDAVQSITRLLPRAPNPGR